MDDAVVGDEREPEAAGRVAPDVVRMALGQAVHGLLDVPDVIVGELAPVGDGPADPLARRGGRVLQVREVSVRRVNRPDETEEEPLPGLDEVPVPRWSGPRHADSSRRASSSVSRAGPAERGPARLDRLWP